MVFTLKQAGLLSSKTLRNEIVRDFDNQSRRTGEGVANTQDVFPLVELSNSTETFFRQNGARTPMQATNLTAESPISDIEALTEDDVTVQAYKEKISPEKGVDTEVNSEQEIYRLFQQAANVLREDVALTRDVVSWRGDDMIDGMVGQDGLSAHPEIPTDNVITPATPYSDNTTSAPQSDFQFAEYLIDEEGSGLASVGGITAYVPPSVLFDMKQNQDLADRFSGVEVQGLNQEQVASVLPFDTIEKVRMKVPRQNPTTGEFVDANGNPATSPEDAVMDNILEPWDGTAQNRNIVIGAPGEGSAFMPWFADRLAEHANNAPPSGDFAVDMQAGLMTQTWTENDPVVSWLKVAQEVGFHLHRPRNWVIIQDI